jgi:hypothetical protein
LDGNKKERAADYRNDKQAGQARLGGFDFRRFHGR